MLTLPSKHILFFCWLSGNSAANISIIDRESVLLMQDFVIQCVWRMSPICRVLAFCGSFFFFFFLPEPRLPGTASRPGKAE